MADTRNISEDIVSVNLLTQNIILKELIIKYYPYNAILGDFYFYKQHLAHFKSPDLDIQSDNFENSEVLIFIRFISASYITGYDFVPSDKSNIVRMRIHIRSDNKTTTKYLDELEPVEIEQQFFMYLEEQLIIEKKISSSPLSALILSLQRSCKLKEWQIKTSMAKSLIAVNQLIYKTT